MWTLRRSKHRRACPRTTSRRIYLTGKFLVAYAGSIGISNAMDVFFECVESCNRIQDIHFVVLGDGDLRQTYVDRYGSLPNLTFAPRVPKSRCTTS